MFFLTVADDIKWWVKGAIRGLFSTLCEFVYTIMSWIWELLMSVSRIRLLNSGACTIKDVTEKLECISQGGMWDDSPITSLYRRFTLLLGIIMTFYIIFQFIKYLITPEEIEDKEKGIERLGFKLLTVVVLLALTPTIFDKAYDVQELILTKNVLPKIILGKTGMNNSTFGRDFSASLMSNFYYVEGFEESDDPDEFVESKFECDGIACNLVVSRTLGLFRSTGKLVNLDYGLTYHGDVGGSDIYYIHFDGLFALVVGLFITYMLLMYTIDVGARVVQLTFLQMIAPIPIIAYLSPKKDGTFQKWAKQCWVTYIDLFIRLVIIYFTTLLIESIGTNYESLLPDLDKTSSLPFFIYLVLILGLMMFCKRAPKMVQELFPSMGVASGSFGLKPGDRPLVSNAIGMIGGATTGLRTLAMRAAGQIRRNRSNRDIRGEINDDYKTKKDDLESAQKRVKELSGKGNLSKEEQEELATLNKQMAKKKRDLADAKIARSNTRYRSAALAGLGGFVGGTVRGAAKGATLKEIKGFKDFRGKMQEVEKAETQRTAAVDTWYNTGGQGGIAGTVSRTIAGVESSLGLETPKARMEQRVRVIDSKIKANDAYANIEADTKSKRDAVETRLSDKLEKGELKSTVSTSFLKTDTGNRTIKGLEGLDLSSMLTAEDYATLDDNENYKNAERELNDAVESGDSERISAARKNFDDVRKDEALKGLRFSQLTGRYSAAAEQAQLELDKKIKDQKDYSKDLEEIDKNTSMNDTEKSAAREAVLAEQQKQEESIAQARAALQKAQDNAKAVKKYSMRRAFDQALRAGSSFSDQVAYQKIEDSKKSIEVARSNGDIIRRFVEVTDREKKQKLNSAINSERESLVASHSDWSKEQIDQTLEDKLKDENDELFKNIQNIESGYEQQKALFLGQKDFSESNYDELDDVVVRLNNIAANRKRENQTHSEEKRQIEASYRYDAAKADDAFNSSGKK